MNLENLHFQLSELRVHVDDLLESISNGSIGEGDEASLAVELGHLLDHVNLAWNLRGLKPEDFASVNDEVFQRASNTVPNFGLNRTLARNEYYTVED